MKHPIWSNPPFKTPIPSPLSDGLAYLHMDIAQWQDFRGEPYKWQRMYYVCDETGEEFTTCELDNSNVEQIYSQYRRRYGIPAPHELTMFRASLDLSAAIMSKLLGFGPNQWTRYEQGEVPNRTNGLLLRLALRDRNAWYSLLEAGAVFFSKQPRLYARLLGKVLPA